MVVVEEVEKDGRGVEEGSVDEEARTDGQSVYVDAAGAEADAAHPCWPSPRRSRCGSAAEGGAAASLSPPDASPSASSRARAAISASADVACATVARSRGRSAMSALRSILEGVETAQGGGAAGRRGRRKAELAAGRR